MNPLIIIIPVLVVLAGVLLIASARRRDTGDATGLLSRETVKRDKGESPALDDADAGPTGREVERSAELERRGSDELVSAGAPDLSPYVPPDPDAIGVTRRQFFNRSIILLFALGLSSFGAAVIAFLWPTPKGGFGSKIRVGAVDDLKTQIADGDGFLYFAEGRMWMTNYPDSAIEKAPKAYPAPRLPSLEAGIAVLYQKCPHLGCRVPSCATSQWFECGCHGSQYNQAGEKKGGPAPRGMDGFANEVSGGVLTVDTGTVVNGPPIGTNTTGQEAAGPHCVGGHH